MQFVRKLLLVLLAPLFTLLLYATAVDVGFVRVATHPATVKSILAKSGVYNNVVPSLLSQSGAVSYAGSSVSLENSVVHSAALQTFTPQLVQQDSESAIDGMYDWLNGSTPLPDFQINLASVKQTFAANVAQAVQQHLQSLPACTSTAQAAGFDPLAATCLPKGVTAASAAATVQSTITNGKGFLDNPVITATDIKNSNTGQSVFASDKIKKIPDQYQKAKKTPYVFTALLVVIGLAIVFLSSTRAAGLRRIGWPMLIVGLLMLAFAWAINHFTAHTLVPKISINNSVLQSSLKSLIVNVEQVIDKNYWYFGGAYTCLGVAALGGSFYLKRSQKAVVAAAPGNHHTPPAAGPPSAPTAVPAAPRPAQPRPKRIVKIQ